MCPFSVILVLGVSSISSEKTNEDWTSQSIVTKKNKRFEDRSHSYLASICG